MSQKNTVHRRPLVVVRARLSKCDVRDGSYIDAGAEEDVHKDLEETQGLEGDHGSTDGTKDSHSGGVAVGFYGVGDE